MKCTIDQLLLINSHVHPKLPEPLVDFTRLFPRHVSLKIFAFLDPRSLCRATQVGQFRLVAHYVRKFQRSVGIGIT